MKFYSYWEGGVIPPYLRLCVQTWFKYLPDLEVELINQEAAKKWISEYYNFENFKKLSYPMQSDAVSAAVLAAEGGTFIDLDTIITSPVAADFFATNSPVLKAFGKAPGMHIAVLSTGKPGNPVATTWRAAVAARIANMPNRRQWNYIGNEPLDIIVQDPRWQEHIEIVDREVSGNILESVLSPMGAGRESYHSLFFGEDGVSVAEALRANTAGIISLHNSWTPKEVSSLTDLGALLSSDGLLFRLLRHLLGDSPEFVSKQLPAQLVI